VKAPSAERAGSRKAIKATNDRHQRKRTISLLAFVFVVVLSDGRPSRPRPGRPVVEASDAPAAATRRQQRSYWGSFSRVRCSQARQLALASKGKGRRSRKKSFRSLDGRSDVFPFPLTRKTRTTTNNNRRRSPTTSRRATAVEPRATPGALASRQGGGTCCCRRRRRRRRQRQQNRKPPPRLLLLLTLPLRSRRLLLAPRGGTKEHQEEQRGLVGEQKRRRRRRPSTAETSRRSAAATAPLTEAEGEEEKQPGSDNSLLLRRRPRLRGRETGARTASAEEGTRSGTFLVATAFCL